MLHYLCNLQMNSSRVLKKVCSPKNSIYPDTLQVWIKSKYSVKEQGKARAHKQKRKMRCVFSHQKKVNLSVWG